MLFAALDVHKKEIEAVLLNEAGQVQLRQRLATDRETLEAFARRHLRDYAVALEATTNCWAIAHILQPLCREVVVSNPLRTRAIAEAKIKTDRVDALVLAQLLRCDYLPRVWCPHEETRRMRQQSTERANLSADRTRLKNRIHSILHQRLIHVPVEDLFSQRGRAWLKSLALDEEGATALGRQLRLLGQVEEELAAMDRHLAEAAYEQPDVKLLMTLPGVDVTVAQTIAAALGDVSRFPDADRAAAYLGLVPSTRQSGDHCYHGRITKQGASHARWMLVQAAQQVGRHPGPLGVFFRRLAQRKNRNVAVVATARKLVTIAWHMLKNNEPYRYAQPKTVEAKLSRLRVRATGQKKKGGLGKGQPRPANYGSGVRTRAVPSLDRIYANEQLPPIAALKNGEQTMLANQGVATYAASVRKTDRVPRRSSS
ncbi:MAG TPA: IS110 family transposase [Bryobacteraceae bacterium]|jgi:transposase|nr:IS110 family transposase [Bryobacteraceae bacterium]